MVLKILFVCYVLFCAQTEVLISKVWIKMYTAGLYRCYINVNLAPIIMHI